MSVREDEQKKSCPSRGLGLAAAAIGVGVGAALYYFFNKRNEDQESEGSTSQEWTCEHPQAFQEKIMSNSKEIWMTPVTKNRIGAYNNNNTPETEAYDNNNTPEHGAYNNKNTPEPGAYNNKNTPEPGAYNNKNTPETKADNNETPQSSTSGSYVTISETTTTDTSMMETDDSDISYQNNVLYFNNQDVSVEINGAFQNSDVEFSVAINFGHSDNEADDGDMDISNDEYLTTDGDDPDFSENDIESVDSNSSDDEAGDEISSESEFYSASGDETYEIENSDEYFSDELSPASSSSESDTESDNDQRTSKRQPPLPRMNTNESEPDISGWEVTESAAEVPETASLSSLQSGSRLTADRPYVLVRSSSGRRSPLEYWFRSIGNKFDIRFVHTKTRDAERMRDLREQAFRERSWSLEECAICFEIMLKDQSLMSLPCTHNFHVQCIGPWLQEKHTCPVCRKAAE